MFYSVFLQTVVMHEELNNNDSILLHDKRRDFFVTAVCNKLNYGV